MKYLLFLFVIVLINSELIITEVEAKPPLTPPQQPFYPKHPDAGYTIEPTPVPTPAILPQPTVFPETVPEQPKDVVIGKKIPTNKEYYSTTEGFYNDKSPQKARHQKSRHGHKNNDNKQLRGGFDPSSPNYYPYYPTESYQEYEFSDEEAFATGVFIFFSLIVLVAVLVACKKRRAMKRARKMQRAAAQLNAQGGNVIENINSQIRYHQQESNRLRASLLEQQQREQQEYQRRAQEQQRQQAQYAQPQRYPQQYQQYQHQLPPPIVSRQLNETQQPIRRGDYPEQSQIHYGQNNFNYHPQNSHQNYPYPPPQIPYRPFRNEEEVSVIHNQVPVASETFSDYPRL